MDRTGIALGGNLILDHYKEIDAYPSPSTLTSIRAIHSEPGGLASNCALALARIDPALPLNVIGRVADDESGALVRERFRAHRNIDLNRLIVEGEQSSGGGTSFTDAMIDVSRKTRTYFQYRGSNARLCADDFHLDTLKARILHVGYILLLDALDAADEEFGTAMARLLHDAKARGIKTSIDVVSEDSDRFSQLVPAALRHADYAIINEFEASRTTGIPVRDESGRLLVDRALVICEQMLQMGVSTWAVIHAREGAVGLSSDGQRAALSALDVPAARIISTIGAGDAFLAGCLHQAYHGQPLEKALRMGLASAATSLLQFNATDGILPADALLRFYHDSPKETWPGFEF